MMYLFVPYIFLRDGSRYEIPTWLQRKASARFRLHRCVDSGPATHMHEVLKLEKEPFTYILQAFGSHSSF